MTITHCVCCPSCHLEMHSNTMCFVCLTLEHCLPRGRVTSSLWSVLCSFLCRSMPWDCSPTAHSLCLTYVDVEPSSYRTSCHVCSCWSSLLTCTMFQTWVKLYLQIVSGGWSVLQKAGLFSLAYTAIHS